MTLYDISSHTLVKHVRLAKFKVVTIFGIWHERYEFHKQTICIWLIDFLINFYSLQLTFFVMLKELKYCNNVSLLEVTDSVKNKAREYIKKYMSKFGKTYIRDENEKDYHFEDL